MSKFLATLVFLACLSFAPIPLAAQGLVVFGGYSYMRPPVTATEVFSCTVTPCTVLPVPPFNVTNTQNLSGWELSGTYRFLPFLGLTADLSANYGTSVPGSGSRVHQYTGLAGPEVSLPAKVSPFAHVLFGGTHQTITSGSIPTTGGQFDVQPNTVHSFATAVGAGIDLKLIPHVWFRAIQIDYIVTHLHNGTHNQPRVSTGLVLHF